MGFFKALGEVIERSAERERDRRASQSAIEDHITQHNRDHNDDLVVVSRDKVAQPSSCPTGLYGWATSFDAPIGVSVRICGACGRYHLTSAMEVGR